MKQGYTWHMDPETTQIVQEFAKDCDRTFEEAATICLLNGLSYTLAVALNRGSSKNVDLYTRVNRASDAMVTDAPREIHYTHPNVGRT